MKHKTILDRFFPDRPKKGDRRQEIEKVLEDIRARIGDIQKKIELVSDDESCEKLKELSLDDLRIVMIKLRQAVDSVRGRDAWVKKEIDRIRSAW